MSLADEAKHLAKPRGTPCGARKFLDLLDPSEQDEVADCLSDPAISDRMLTDALKARGHEWVPKLNVWGHHRRGECRCGPQG